MIRQAELDMTFTPAQETIFYETKARRIPVHKGRRLGFTRGAAQAFCDFMIEDPGMYMWGDTINGNIDRYVSRYFMPILRQIPKDHWNWQKQSRELTLFDSTIDFRSADKPENWEGFGYKRIVLNEAGIILKNPYLWENAVQPMLLDFPDSICYIGGTPKGKNLFHDLTQYGYDPDKKNWQSLHYSTFDNPFLTQSAIHELMEEIPDSTIRQEIYGEFLDTTENQFIEGDVVEEAAAMVLPSHAYHDSVKVLGVDVARFGDDSTVLYKRQGKETISITVKDGLKTGQIVNLVAWELNEWKPDACFIDVGYNPGVYDDLEDLGHDVIAVNFGGASDSTYYKNKRAEMWGNMRDWLATGGSIPNDSKLKRELTAQTYDFVGKDGAKLILTS